MSKNVVIIGGGIMGLSTAYYLLKEGHQVTVIDQSDISSGASFVNAGFISPSHIIPLSSPGIITKGLKWMLNEESPFYIKPRLDKELLQWAWYFKKSATAKKVKKAIPVIKDISMLSLELFNEIKKSGDIPFSIDNKGLLMIYKTEKAGEEELKVGALAEKQGMKVQNLSAAAVNKLDPKANLDIKGAVHYLYDSHMTPGEYMEKMYLYLKQKGVTFYTNEEALDVTLKEGKVSSVSTRKRTVDTDELVIAAGSWSPLLTKKIGLHIPMQAGKGYRIDVYRDTGISIPAILIETKVAITPMKGFTRFAGTMEIAGINQTINPVRVHAIAKSAESYYKGLKITEEEKAAAACGLRPCTPDGLPYIGRTSNCKNVTIATGHAMMGWTLGPATGKLVCEIISDKKPTLDLTPYHPERSF
ncbi:NAD(P)/FAD-dependent oxidoreductase [Lutibacter sp.]